MHQVHVQHVLIGRWHDDNDKDGALDVTVTGPLVKTNVRAAVAEAGSSLAFDIKVQGAAVACQQQGLVFSQLAVETVELY